MRKVEVNPFRNPIRTTAVHFTRYLHARACYAIQNATMLPNRLPFEFTDVKVAHDG
jgi:hypothetical protein